MKIGLALAKINSYIETSIKLIKMALTQDEVKHVAKLARLKLTVEEEAKYGKQLSQILDYMEILDEVNTDKVEATAQVTDLKNVVEKDEVKKDLPGQEELLACSELPIERKQIKVKAVFK